jgi:hypothetical protein
VLSHPFEIIDAPPGLTGIIGRDLFRPLNITISGLPLPDSAITLAPEDQKESLFSDSDSDDGNCFDHPLARHPSLLSAIERNAAIPPNSFCSMPEAVVYLDTGDVKPVYRRQFQISHSLQPIVTEQINKWYQDGKIHIIIL